MPETGTMMIENLPEGTELVAGDKTYVVGPDGSADITDWPTEVLTIRPPVDFVGEIDASVVIEVEMDSGDTARQEHPLAIEVSEADVSGPTVEIVGGFEASYLDVDHTLRTIDDIDWDGEPTDE